MGDVMMFPKTMMEFVEEYSFKDRKEIYTNGSDLIPVFRVKQAIDHYEVGQREKVQRCIERIEKKRYTCLEEEKFAYEQARNIIKQEMGYE